GVRSARRPHRAGAPASVAGPIGGAAAAPDSRLLRRGSRSRSAGGRRVRARQRSRGGQTSRGGDLPRLHARLRRRLRLHGHRGRLDRDPAPADAARAGAARIRRHRGRPDRHLSRGNAGRLAADRPHAGEAVRREPRRAVPDAGRRSRPVLSDQPRGVHPLALRVIKPGMLTTVQDAGRWGYQAHGVPVAGPMDPCSHRLANALVGNARAAAALEVTLLGPEIEFDEERVIAIAGAEFAVTLDGRSAPLHAPFVVPPGARLTFGARHRGARAYLAIAGGIATPPVLGSRATHVISRMGGLDGRPLRAGDVLPLFNARRVQSAGAPTAPVLPMPERDARIRVMAGPQQDRFRADALDALLSAPYTIRQDSDRMGFRLQGPPLAHADGADIISDATPL